MMMSSRYTKMKSSPLSTLSIYLWKVLLAFLRPKVIRRNSHSPNGVMMAVFGMAAACMRI
jgi:hypothetical protein